MQLIKERRRFLRVKDNIFVLFQSVKGKMSFETITEDISQNGLMFTTSNFIPERTELQFEIQQPLNSNKGLFLPIAAKVRVMWSRKKECNDEYVVGGEIIEMNEENQNRIKGYVDNSLKFKRKAFFLPTC